MNDIVQHAWAQPTKGRGHHPPTKGKGKAFRWLQEHVNHQGDACLIWPFGVDRRVNRGMLGHNGKRYWAHRLMCELAHPLRWPPKVYQGTWYVSSVTNGSTFEIEPPQRSSNP